MNEKILACLLEMVAEQGAVKPVFEMTSGGGFCVRDEGTNEVWGFFVESLHADDFEPCGVKRI